MERFDQSGSIPPDMQQAYSRKINSDWMSVLGGLSSIGTAPAYHREMTTFAPTKPTAEEMLREEVENAMLSLPCVKRFMERLLPMEWLASLYPRVYPHATP